MRVRRSLRTNDVYFTRLFHNTWLDISHTNSTYTYYAPSLNQFLGFSELAHTYEMFKIHKVLVKLWPTTNNLGFVVPTPTTSYSNNGIYSYVIAPIYQNNANAIPGGAGQPPEGTLQDTSTGSLDVYSRLMALPQAKSARFPRPLSLLYKPKLSYMVSEVVDKRVRPSTTPAGTSLAYPATISNFPWLSTQGFDTPFGFTPDLSGFGVNLNGYLDNGQSLRFNMEVFIYASFRKRINTMRPLPPPALAQQMDDLSI